MVTRGRTLLEVERYKKGEASLGRAELAEVPLGKMMTILTEHRVEQGRTGGLSAGAPGSS